MASRSKDFLRSDRRNRPISRDVIHRSSIIVPMHRENEALLAVLLDIQAGREFNSRVTDGDAEGIENTLKLLLERGFITGERPAPHAAIRYELTSAGHVFIDDQMGWI